MIIELLCEVVLWLLNVAFSWIQLPSFPIEINNAINTMYGYIESALGFVWLVLPYDLVVIIIPIVIAVENFDRLYSMTMWILRKIPFLNIQ